MVDNINLPFVCDDEMIGNWKYYNFIKYPAKFHIFKKKWRSDRSVESLHFDKNGYGITKYCNKKLEKIIRWTKGHVIDVDEGFDMLCHIETRLGKKYLIMEWKSGDYLYRDEVRGYYVFKKEA